MELPAGRRLMTTKDKTTPKDDQGNLTGRLFNYANNPITIA